MCFEGTTQESRTSKQINQLIKQEQKQAPVNLTLLLLGMLLIMKYLVKNNISSWIEDIKSPYIIF